MGTFILTFGIIATVVLVLFAIGLAVLLALAAW
jgi:hypothetical protein